MFCLYEVDIFPIDRNDTDITLLLKLKGLLKTVVLNLNVYDTLD
jgi:hypothetical protein